MRCGVLDVTERDPGVERSGDEAVAQRVRRDVLGDPGRVAQAADHPGGGVAVHPLTVRPDEDRTMRAFADAQVDGSGGAWGERNRHLFAALAQDPQRAVAAFGGELLDVRAERLGDPQPVQCQQRCQGVILVGGQPRGDEEPAEFVRSNPNECDS